MLARIRMVVAGLALLALPLWPAAAAGLEAADQQAIQTVIAAQIAAFKADDAKTAFSYAAPAIQAQFTNPERFVAMVKASYPPVYRPRAVEFGELAEVDGRPTQRVLITGPESAVYAAYYLMQKQPDGAWRIGGCILQPAGDRAI